MVEKLDYGFASYILGIVSIVTGAVAPVAGLILGIVTLSLASKEKGELSRRGKKFGIIGIVVSIVSFALSMAIVYWATNYATNLGI